MRGGDVGGGEEVGVAAPASGYLSGAQRRVGDLTPRPPLRRRRGGGEGGGDHPAPGPLGGPRDDVKGALWWICGSLTKVGAHHERVSDSAYPAPPDCHAPCEDARGSQRRRGARWPRPVPIRRPPDFPDFPDFFGVFDFGVCDVGARSEEAGCRQIALREDALAGTKGMAMVPGCAGVRVGSGMGRRGKETALRLWARWRRVRLWPSMRMPIDGRWVLGITRGQQTNGLVETGFRV